MGQCLRAWIRDLQLSTCLKVHQQKSSIADPPAAWFGERRGGGLTHVLQSNNTLLSCDKICTLCLLKLIEVKIDPIGEEKY